jgi:hypothetical protein
MHGARKPETIKRGHAHPNYKNGQYSQVARAERSRKLAELRKIETLLFALGLAVGPRWRGRKPKTTRK